MANCKALVAAILLCLCFVRIRCDAVPVSPSASPEQEQEIQKLRSKVASLEDEIGGRKEETLLLESIVREKTAKIAALVGELEVLQVTNVFDDESVMKANTHNEMIEKQIERLGNDLEDQVKKGESLETRASEAEKSLLELTRKLECVEKTNINQRQKIEEFGHNLQHAKDKLSEVEREAKLKAEELTKVHNMWLPHWLVVRFVHCQVQELASAKWQLRRKPLLNALMQKKLGPVVKVHFNSLKKTTELYVSAVAIRSTTSYRVCRDATQPSMVKAREFAYHYWQESKKFSKPYITQIVASSEPHLSRANAVLDPFLRPVMSAWRRLVMSGSVYHRQVKKGVRHFLEDNELLKPVSADRLAWFTASALFALPMFSIYKMFSATICKKIRGTQDRGRSRSSNRKQKRRVDK